MEPFWPRRSPHFLACRRAVRPFEGPAVIGLSGGPDSLALVAAAAAEGKDVRAVVVDHQLQPGSGEVAARAAEQARAFGVEAEVVAVDVAAGNVEAAARRARYAALFARGREVWVAHTADDQAETLLLGALRGNPAGMATAEEREEGRLVRPFLQLRRADTVGACAELSLKAWHDPMNDDPAFRRVALRTHVIPALSELLGGDAVPPLAATADRIAQARAVLDAPLGPPTTRCDQLAGEDVVTRRRRLAKWLLAEGVPLQSDQLDAIDALVTRWRGQGPVHVAGGEVARVDGRLVLRRSR